MLHVSAPQAVVRIQGLNSPPNMIFLFYQIRFTKQYFREKRGTRTKFNVTMCSATAPSRGRHLCAPAKWP